jgi:hypothetical protein
MSHTFLRTFLLTQKIYLGALKLRKMKKKSNCKRMKNLLKTKIMSKEKLKLSKER